MKTGKILRKFTYPLILAFRNEKTWGRNPCARVPPSPKGDWRQPEKTWGPKPPCTRFSRSASNYDLHEMAGGLPLTTFSAPNIHPSSKRGREVCNPAGKSNIPLKKCGSKRTLSHQAGRKLFVCFLIKRIHDQVIDRLKFPVILNGAQQRLSVFFRGL